MGIFILFCLRKPGFLITSNSMAPRGEDKRTQRTCSSKNCYSQLCRFLLYRKVGTVISYANSLLTYYSSSPPALEGAGFGSVLSGNICMHEPNLILRHLYGKDSILDGKMK